jgi:hypothetical protein
MKRRTPLRLKRMWASAMVEAESSGMWRERAT